MHRRPARVTTAERVLNRPTRRGAAARIAGLAAAGMLLVGVTACGDDAERSAEAAAPVTTQPASTSTTVESSAPAMPAGGAVLDVVATDFAFAGLADTMAAGTYTLSFRNESASEQHEIVLFENLEGRSLEELAAMGPDEAAAHVRVVGVLFAAPGEAAAETVTVELTPGDYVATCFIPTPTDGQAHFAHGMVQEITVA